MPITNTVEDSLTFFFFLQRKQSFIFHVNRLQTDDSYDTNRQVSFLWKLMIKIRMPSIFNAEVSRELNWFKPPFPPQSVFLVTVPRRFFCCSCSLFVRLCFHMWRLCFPYFFPNLSFFWCLGRAVLRTSGIFGYVHLHVWRVTILIFHSNILIAEQNGSATVGIDSFHFLSQSNSLASTRKVASRKHGYIILTPLNLTSI